MKKTTRIALLSLAALIALPVLFVGGSIAYFKAGRAADFRSQSRRLGELGTLPPGGQPMALRTGSPEASVLTQTGALDRPLNELRLVATHNSYHRQPDALRSFFLGLGAPGEPAKLAYSHRTLWEQLESGLRSFELDVRLRGERFEITHVPLVDDRTASPSLAGAFEELALWSARSPGHLPLFVLLELKDDWEVLDPKLRPFDRVSLQKLDALARDTLGPLLYAPDELRGGYASPLEAVRERAWPPIGALLGRVIVIIHENKRYRDEYIAAYGPALKGGSFFTCASKGGAPSEDDGLFAILNDPGDPRIADALASRLIVRTRADADAIADPLKAAAALASGAQLVSTDYPPGGPAHASGYGFSFGGAAAALSP
ncbi:MAG TPA: hypothetical protein DCG47_01175 [Spirochaetaceae bacterium]|nr:hypothetical protein [Spirochaetaceae bacterium]